MGIAELVIQLQRSAKNESMENSITCVQGWNIRKYGKCIHICSKGKYKHGNGLNDFDRKYTKKHTNFFNCLD